MDGKVQTRRVFSQLCTSAPTDQQHSTKQWSEIKEELLKSIPVLRARGKPFKSALKGQFEMLMWKPRNKGQMCNYAPVFPPRVGQTYRRKEEESSIQRDGRQNNAQEGRQREAGGVYKLYNERLTACKSRLTSELTPKRSMNYKKSREIDAQRI